jgi:outer membrane protein TolC
MAAFPRKPLLNACFTSLLGFGASLCAAELRADGPLPTLFPEQRVVEARPAEELPSEPLGSPLHPRSVYWKADDQPWLLSLDEAIRIALANDDVIRILAGNTAVASGRTIYDPAIANTAIDAQNARFDPTLGITNSWNRFEAGQSFFDPLNPGHALIVGSGTGNYDFRTGIDKTNALGGTASLGVSTSPTWFRNTLVPLNNVAQPAAELSYRQPLLQGAGTTANLAPIVIARIGTERSFYQLKDTVQEQVRSVVDGYWNLVVARVDVWVRRRQVEQAEEALRVGEARFRGNINDIAQVAQARSALQNFRAALVTAEANVIQREAALRNLLGLPPSDGTELIPVTDPRRDRYVSDWDALCDLAAEYRPDLIDLQLALQSDQQSLALARNTAQPRVDALALYRWKGQYGVQPNGSFLDTPLNEFNDWSLGVNLSVPLGLRQSRAQMRQTELALARDQANLRQGRHAAVHQLATTTRLIDQTYEQFLAYTEARKAARVNLQYQTALFENGRTIYLNVLQAITDWGNTISSEANSLTLYNTQLATLERQTGTILETHGVYFYEEQFGSRGPWGRLGSDRCYPLSLRPNYENRRYSDSQRPSDESFELEKPQSPIDRDPLPELPYRNVEDNTPPDGTSPQGLPRLDNSDTPLPELPGLPELRPDLNGPPPLPPIPNPQSRRGGLDDNPFAGARQSQQSAGPVIPVGNNKLQGPAGPRDSQVQRTTYEPPARSTPLGSTPAPSAPPADPRGAAPIRTPSDSGTTREAPRPRKSAGWKRLFGG